MHRMTTPSTRNAEIYVRHLLGESYAAIAREVGLSAPTVRSVCKGYAWGLALGGERGRLMRESIREWMDSK